MRHYHKAIVLSALLAAGPAIAQNNDYQPGTTGQRQQKQQMQDEQTRGAEQLRQQQNQRRTVQAIQTDGQEWRQGQQQTRQNKRVLWTSAGDIAGNPQRFYGKTVRVQAEVEDVKGGTVFTLDEEKLFAGPDVLVVAPGGISAPREGTVIEVTGRVREFVSQDVYTDYDWYGYGWYGYNWDYYNDVWTDWDRRPVIIADSIISANGRELVMQQTNQRPGGPRQLVYVAEPGDILANAPDYYGSTVSVRADVAETLSPHVFKLDEDRLFQTSDLMVIVPRPAGRVVEDRNVTVVGTVRPFVRSEFERDYGWFGMNMFGDEDIAEWELQRQPVIIAKSVRTENGRELVQGPGTQQRQTREGALGGTRENLEGETGRSQDSGDWSDRW